jgi:hypothetical protein
MTGVSSITALRLADGGDEGVTGQWVQRVDSANKVDRFHAWVSVWDPRDDQAKMVRCFTVSHLS